MYANYLSAAVSHPYRNTGRPAVTGTAGTYGYFGPLDVSIGMDAARRPATVAFEPSQQIPAGKARI